MKMKFEDIQEAFDFINFVAYGEHVAVLDKSTGRIYKHSELGDFEPIPDRVLESIDVVEIPHKNDLGLGQELVFEFVRREIPDDYEAVRTIFKRRGAYAQYKYLLQSKGLLQRWYDLYIARQEKALRKWCEENGVETTG